VVVFERDVASHRFEERAQHVAEGLRILDRLSAAQQRLARRDGPMGNGSIMEILFKPVARSAT
jgi:hypothetical protein